MTQEHEIKSEAPNWSDCGFSHSIANEDQLERLNACAEVPLRFTGLPRSGFGVSFAGTRSDTLSIWRTTSDAGFTSYPISSAELVSVRFVERGVMSRIDQRGVETAVSYNQVLCASFDLMRSERAMPGFSAVAATVRRSALVEAVRLLGADDALRLATLDVVANVDAVKLAGVRLSLYALQRQLAQDSNANLMAPLLEEVFLYQLISSWPSNTPPLPSAIDGVDRSVRSALDYIEGHLARRIMLREIAEVAGMNVRSLQTAFNQRLGCGPTAYLIGRRLDKVRSELLSGEMGSIRQIAGNWGFVHMSDFAERYRRRFGVLPHGDRR